MLAHGLLRIGFAGGISGLALLARQDSGRANCIIIHHGQITRCLGQCSRGRTDAHPVMLIVRYEIALKLLSYINPNRIDNDRLVLVPSGPPAWAVPVTGSGLLGTPGPVLFGESRRQRRDKIIQWQLSESYGPFGPRR